jgi:xylose dehydrogenase (NAD/NADP)
MIRFGVLGTAKVVPYGHLAPAKETQGVEVRGIASRTPQKAEEFAARYGIQRGFGSYEALLESRQSKLANMYYAKYYAKSRLQRMRS